MKKIIPWWIKYLYASVSVIFLVIIFAEHNNMLYELIVSAAVYILFGGICAGIGLVAVTRSKAALSGLIIFFLLLR